MSYITVCYDCILNVIKITIFSIELYNFLAKTLKRMENYELRHTLTGTYFKNPYPKFCNSLSSTPYHAVSL